MVSRGAHLRTAYNVGRVVSPHSQHPLQQKGLRLAVTVRNACPDIAKRFAFAVPSVHEHKSSALEKQCLIPFCINQQSLHEHRY